MISASTTTTSTGGFTESTFQSFLRGRDEPSWLTDRRREAFAHFQAFAWPTARDEEWRRTDIRAFKLENFAPPCPDQPAGATRTALDGLWESLSSHYATGIEHVNGAAVRLADSSRLGGALFLDLHQAVRNHPDLVRRYLLTQAVKPADDIFAALHAAFWTGGTLLYVPRGLKVEAPLFSLVGLTHEGRVDLSHTLVVLEEGAEATLVRETASSRQGRDSRTSCWGARGRPGRRLSVPAGQYPKLGFFNLALQP